MKINLREGEHLDDLELGGLMLIQKHGGYKFSTDSVLLSSFAKIKSNDVYVDLCSGSGVVAILVTFKCGLKNAYAVEIQPRLSDMAERSAKFNNLPITVLNEDLRQVFKTLGHESVDAITVNPPYNQAGVTSETDEIAKATHEICVNLREICEASAKLLKFGGKIFMVHRADRLAEIMFELKSASLEPKRLRVVYPKQGKEPNLVLIEAKKGAKPGLKIESPLILNNDDGTETDELKKIYNRK